MTSAHAAAVEAVAVARAGHHAPDDFDRAAARKYLAALTSSEAVREAIEHAPCLLHPDQDKCGGANGANVRFHLPCILAALAPPEAT